MAIFKKKENKEESVKDVKKDEKVVETTNKSSDKKPSVLNSVHDVTWVLRKARITEKAAISAESKVYVFEVDQRSTKKDISLAIEDLYKVKPVKINIAKIPSKKVTRRKKSGTTTGYKAGKKKAYVFLNKKDSIEIV